MEDRERKREDIREDKYKSLKKKKRKGFSGIPPWKKDTLLVEENNVMAINDEGMPPSQEQGSSSSSQQDEGNNNTVQNNVANETSLVDVSANKITGKEIVLNRANDETTLHGYKIIDSNILEEVINFCSKCKKCGQEKCISMRQYDKARRGLSEKLYLYCLHCNETLKTFYTSTTNDNNLVDINLRSVYAATSSGGGLSLLRNFCGKMNLPAPVTCNPYGKYLNVILKSARDNCEQSMSRAAQKLVHNNSSTTDIPVSIDGTWQKRYGHNSLLGATFLMSIDNGCVLDYSIKSKTCTTCKKNFKPTEEWKKKHAPVCEINHFGSSGSMEKEGAIEMFLRSVEKHNLHYTEYIGDGDTNSFAAVVRAVAEKFGDQYRVTKEDCIGHIQKRMGSALRTYKNNSKGRLLSDGKSVGGTGRLTDKVVDHIQTYYGYAIRNNKGNQEKIVKAIWAIFYHMILGPSYETVEGQHSYCPDGGESWCKYKKDIRFGTKTYDRKKCIPFVFRGEIKPIFERLSSNELLNSCQKGLTQNQNEALNNVLWSKCSKRVFIGKKRFSLAVCEAITAFNDGAISTQGLFEKLNITCGVNTSKALKLTNDIRLRNSRLKVTLKYRMQRQKVRSRRKNAGKDDTSYMSGAYSSNIRPDSEVVNVTFVSDQDVKEFNILKGFEGYKGFEYLRDC